MKKFIAIFAVLLFAAPAMAAGPEWSFYGSMRMATWYISNDYGDYDQNGVFDGSSSDSDWGLRWDFQDNSRLGFKVKADKVSGQVELGLNMNDTNAGVSSEDRNSIRGREFNGTNGGDGIVSARRAYGVWKFADNASLKVGKDYSPVSNLVSGQVFADDAGLLGQGDFYGGRPGQIGLQIGGFELALATNPLSAAPAGAGAAGAAEDLDWNVPKIEARYDLKLGMVQLIPFGGFNYYTLSDKSGDDITDDLDVISYVLGLVAKINIGPVYVAGEGAWGQNWANAKWANGAHPDSGTAAAATLDGTDDLNDSESWMALALVGFNFTNTLKFEVGFGYRSDDSGVSGQDEIEAWNVYAQAVITMAPGVYVIPEVGYFDFGDDLTDDDGHADRGSQWYAGAKWQIDF